MSGYGEPEVVELRPDLVMLDMRPGQAYLLRRDALTPLDPPRALLGVAALATTTSSSRWIL